MKTSAKTTVLIFLFLFPGFASTLFACTIFTATSGQTVLFGGNEDQRPNDSFLVVDNSGSLGVVFFATPWAKWPLVMQQGINEKGLCFDANWIPEEKISPHPERKPQRTWAVTELMREASSVEEVLSRIFTYNWGRSISYQDHFADKSGDAAVVHPGNDGELTYTRIAKQKGYLVSTNFNLARLDTGIWFCSRYKAADKMLSHMGPEKDLTPGFMASVLETTHQDNTWSTIYSVVFDLPKLRIYLYWDRQFARHYLLDVEKELTEIAPHRNFSIVSLKELIANIENR